MRTKTSSLLLEQFLSWQSEQGERKTLKEFAEFIGISDKVLNHVFTGKREPTEPQAQLFAVVFHDNRFCEVINIVPKDQDLIYVHRHLSKMDRKVRKRIAEEVAQYVTEPPPENGNGEGDTKP